MVESVEASAISYDVPQEMKKHFTPVELTGNNIELKPIYRVTTNI